MRTLLSQGEERKVEFKNALKDTDRELKLIDSLYSEGLLDSVNHSYRVSTTRALINRLSSILITDQLLMKDSDLQQEKLSQPFHVDLRKSDSLITFYHFRDYIKSITTYNLPTISETRDGRR